MLNIVIYGIKPEYVNKNMSNLQQENQTLTMRNQ